MRKLAWIYVMAWRDDVPIKVGYSSAPAKRAKILQCTSRTPPLRVVATWPFFGIARYVEFELHEKLAAAAIGGEWYALSPGAGCNYVDAACQFFGSLPAEGALETFRRDFSPIGVPNCDLMDLRELVEPGFRSRLGELIEQSVSTRMGTGCSP